MPILADITHQDGATVTGIVGQLVKLGHVSRQRGEDDRRKVYVTVEDAGRQAIEAMRQANLENWRHAFSPGYFNHRLATNQPGDSSEAT